MKGGFYGLRAKELSLVTILLMCTTVFVLTWKRTPLLTTFPPQGGLQLTPVGLGKEKVAFAVKDSKSEKLGKTETENEEIGNQVTENGKTETENKEIGNEKTEMNESVVRKELEEKGKEKKEHEENEKKAAPAGPVKGSSKSSKIMSSNYLSLPNVNNGSTPTDLFGGKNGENLKDHSVNQACNYGNGKWVVDHNRSLYSGFGCKQWLSEMWACRMTRRTDFAYEKLRWQPKDCQLEEFEGSKFLKRMQNKTLAFVGDSLGRQQFQSLMCMVTGGNERNDVIDVGEEYGIARAHGNARPSGWAYRFPSTNTTILYYWSASLCYIEPMDKSNPNTDYAMHLDRPAAFLVQNIHRFDVLVLNTGHHWNRGKLNANRWVMHVRGARNTDKNIQIIWKARNLTVHSIIKWVNSQLPKYPNLEVFYRSISPRHFVGGEWNTGGSCDNTTPMSIGKEVDRDESSDSVAAAAVKGTGVKLLDITDLSQVRDEAHISWFRSSTGSSDCLHWCLPGLPDTWNEILFAQL
ncbi:protein trichome birefringence-like 16 [Humulus lupulus]|uniref:protein trichome birefringence-like 16 n=1 Tax=Humulus lupulus TaxID=3486 RepID=UPI002B40FE6D|nr:protein trichome birefringence-like 16 [Humulus lupulus]